MAASASIKIVKEWTYRQTTRRFSNRYHFDGGNLPDEGHFTTFADNIAAAERHVHSPDVHIVRADYQDAGSTITRFSKDFAEAGTFVTGTARQFPGDAAALLRMATEGRSSKNHPIYCFSYYHGAWQNVSGDADALFSNQRTAYHDYGQAWIDGFDDGSLLHSRCSPLGYTCTSAFVEEYVTHRDLPRHS